MATPLTDSINALTQYANEVTGKQDATLSDAVGRLVEGYGSGDVKPWKVTKIVAQEEIYQRADYLKTWLETVTPQSQYAIFMRSEFPQLGDAKPTRGQATVCMAFVINGNPRNYTRYYNNNMDTRADWGSSYYASIDAGDEYIVLYQE